MDHQLENLGPERFQQLSQALLAISISGQPSSDSSLVLGLLFGEPPLPAGAGFTLQPIDEIDDGIEAAPGAAADAYSIMSFDIDMGIGRYQANLEVHAPIGSPRTTPLHRWILATGGHGRLFADKR